MPSYADALSGLPVGNSGSNGVDAAGNFMAWHPRIFDTRPNSFFDQYVAVTDSASFHLNAHLRTTGIGNTSFDNFELTTWLSYLHCSHAGHSRSSGSWDRTVDNAGRSDEMRKRKLQKPGGNFEHA